MPIARFMASSLGRGGRIALGIALIVLGLVVIGGTAGWVVAALGLVPIAAGTLNFCLFAPILGTPFRGADLK